MGQTISGGWMGEGDGKGYDNGSVGMVSMVVIFVNHMAEVF